MSKGILIWSFASLENMDLAIAAIRASGCVGAETHLRGQIDGNVYWSGWNGAVDYVTGICRGVAFATKDASL